MLGITMYKNGESIEGEVIAANWGKDGGFSALMKNGDEIQQDKGSGEIKLVRGEKYLVLDSYTLFSK